MAIKLSLRQIAQPFLCAVLFSGTCLIAPTVAADDSISASDIADMQKAMKEAEEAMKNLDPETRKQLEQVMKQAGAVPKATDLGAPPQHKAAQLAKIDKHAMTPAELKAFVEKLQPKVAKALIPAARQRADKLDAAVKKSANYTSQLRGSINGLAAIGAWPEATYLSAKLVHATGDAQDISNLAAFLTMQHAETAAIPLLHTLDSRYPQNSTLLNNLGQAYYQMGDSATAEKFLIDAVRINAKHPQANMTRSIIQEARGDHAGAQASVHAALAGGYSNTKEQQLRKTGGKLSKEDVQWHRPIPPDPLGVKSFKPSVYPESVNDLPTVINLEKTSQQSVNEQAAIYKQRAASIPVSTMGQMSSVLAMPFYQRATKILQLDMEQNTITLNKLYATQTKLLETMAHLSQELNQKIESIDKAGEKKYANVPGGYQFDYTCGEVKEAIQKYLDALVPETRSNEAQLADALYRQTNEQVYFAQFMMPANEFERAKWSAKASLVRGPVGATEILNSLSGIVEQRQNACWSKKKDDNKKFKLKEFNDFHCEYITDFTLPGVSMVVKCDTTEVKLDSSLLPVELGWKTKATGKGDEEMLINASAAVSIEAVKVGGHSEFDENGWKSGGVNVGVSKDIGKLSGGPLEISAEAGVTGAIEFDRSGVTDVSVTAGVTSKTSTTFGETEHGGQAQSTLKGDASATWSWNSGFSGDAGVGFDSSAFSL